MGYGVALLGSAQLCVHRHTNSMESADVSKGIWPRDQYFAILKSGLAISFSVRG